MVKSTPVSETGSDHQRSTFTCQFSYPPLLSQGSRAAAEGAEGKVKGGFGGRGVGLC